MVVRAQLLGRILGLRVLRVDGTVLLGPARVAGPVPEPGVREPSNREPRNRPPAGQELAEAARLLEASNHVLDRNPTDLR